MSRKGECLDNAVAESFFSTLKAELLEGHVWRTGAEAQAIFEWIEVFYNRQRLHSSLGYLSPAARMYGFNGRPTEQTDASAKWERHTILDC